MLLRPDFAAIGEAAEKIKRNAAEFPASSMTNPDDKPMEGYMRTLTIAVAAIAILAVGVALHPTPQATAFAPDQLNAQIDPLALQSGIDQRTLPIQQVQEPF
jgi:hypothetical protein